jgi:hypothetical protein
VDLEGRLEGIRAAASRRDWRRLELASAADLRNLDESAADAIGSVDLREYARELEAGLATVAKRIGPGTAAVYWEFDPDNHQEIVFRIRS